MYEIEKVFENTAFALTFILQLILLIVFLRMAWNVGKIRKYFVRDSYESLVEIAKRLEFKGKKAEAIDAYMDCVYISQKSIKTDEMNASEYKSRMKEALLGIKKLGGKLPEGYDEYLN